MASSPSSSIASPPPQQSPSLTPPPIASSPSNSQPNGNADPPTSSAPPPPSSPPPISTAPPPSTPAPPPLPSAPPPASPPATISPPPPANVSPPLVSSPPPRPDPPSAPTLSPPPAAAIPPAASLPPPLAKPPAISPPLPSVPSTPPPIRAGSPPPPIPSGSPPPPIPSGSPPPPIPSGSPPPIPSGSPPPPVDSPPVVVPPPSPAKAKSPPPPSATPPTSSSPPPPVLQPPPPSASQNPPSTPSAPPPKSQKPKPPAGSPPSPPPSNSSGGATPLTPTVSSPPITSGPPSMPSPAASSGDPSNQISPPVGNKSANTGPNFVAVSGGNNSPGGGGLKGGTVAAIAVVTALLVLSLVGAAVWFVRKRKRPVGGYNGGYVMPSPKASSQMSETSHARSPSAPLISTSLGSPGFPYSPTEPGLGNSKSLFTYEELYVITGGFSAQNLLGEGGFGCVYRGTLPDGRDVAVKQLKVGGGQGEREFKAEVEIISRVHHRHLVSLVGYCIAENQRLLVYDYVPNNTLYFHLHEGRPVMDWATRVKVAAGAARGIAYLHEDCHPRIIHRDIKSSNILLDNNFEAQVSDFGLARLAMDCNTHVTTRVMGTFGYLAPEYASSGKLTDKSDVYSFGVMLLELITGRKPVDSSQPIGDESLVEWARPLLTRALDTGYFQDLLDPRLEKNYNESEMLRMIEAAAACIRHSAAMRPRMGQVVRALDSLAGVDLNNGVIPGRSELFNSGLHSADIRLFQRMAFGSQNFSSDFSHDFSQSSWNSRRES